MAEHSAFSASSFEAAMLCPGKPVMEAGLPDRTSIHAATGSVAHKLLELALRDGDEPTAYLERVLQQDGFDVTVDDDMVRAVTIARDNIKAMAGRGQIFSETRVNYASWLQVPEDQAWGTADAIVLVDDEIQVHDYKNGRGVEVSAERNPQMMLYAGGALQLMEDIAGPFARVRMVIHQPNLREAPSEWDCTVDELKAWLQGEARSAAASRLNAARMRPDMAIRQDTDAKWQQAFLRPGEKQCQWCRAAATCPALRNASAELMVAEAPATPDEFDLSEAPAKVAEHSDDPTWLGAALAQAPMVEAWIKAVRAKAEGILLAGGKVPGFKVVQGKAGAREWTDAAAAEAELKRMRLKVEEMYKMTVITPPAAEKLVKAGVIGPRQWPKLQAMITKPEGKPSVAPVSDPRPELVLSPVEDDFQAESSVDDFA